MAVHNNKCPLALSTVVYSSLYSSLSLHAPPSSRVPSSDGWQTRGWARRCRRNIVRDLLFYFCSQEYSWSFLPSSLSFFLFPRVRIVFTAIRYTMHGDTKRSSLVRFVDWNWKFRTVGNTIWHALMNVFTVRFRLIVFQRLSFVWCLFHLWR